MQNMQVMQEDPWFPLRAAPEPDYPAFLPGDNADDTLGYGIQAYNPAKNRASPFTAPTPIESGSKIKELRYQVPSDRDPGDDTLGYGIQAYDPAKTRALPFPAPTPIESGSEIKELRYQVPSAKEIRSVSCVEVTTAKIHDNGLPLLNGLRSSKFGPSAGRPCGTCGAGYSSGQCKHGHPGHYELAAPPTDYGDVYGGS